MRFYGLAYKLPNVNTSNLDSLIDDLKTDNLNDTEKSLLQNRTQDLASIPIPSANLSAVVLANGTNVATTPIQLNTTDDVGEIDQFVIVPGLQGASGAGVQIVETGILNATGPGNGTAILVPEQGISVVSDIDDVLRITKVYIPNQGLFNSFVEPYVNVPGIAELFAHWLKSLPNASFHYDTTTPVQLTRTYVEYLFSNFPVGSLEMRPINISDPSQILDARQDSLLKLFQTFPSRKFGMSLQKTSRSCRAADRITQFSSATPHLQPSSPPTPKSHNNSQTTSHASSSATPPPPTRTTRSRTARANSKT